MDTHALNPVQAPPVGVEIPGSMFFDALDYNPGAAPRTKPLPDQAKVARARARSVAGLHQLKEQLGSAIGHLRTADAYGQVTSSMDVLVGVVDAIHQAAHDLAKLADNAEARYEEFFEAPPIELPAGVDTPPTTPAGAPPAAGAAASVVVTMDKPAVVALPGSVAFLARGGRMANMMQGRS